MRWALLVLLATLLGVALLAKLEFGGRGDLPMQLDELYFATCAARGLVSGEVPVAGCHDNKGPLIFLLYQSVMDPAHPYRLATIKLAGFTLGGLVCLLGGLVAHRVGGRVAAVLTLALALQSSTLDPWFFSLRTESLGLACLLLATLVLLPRGTQPLAWWRVLLAGVLCGLALLTRQNFLFLVLGIAGWLAFTQRGGLHRLALLALLFGTGVLAPMLAFALIFQLQGTLPEYGASLFIYPALYGSNGDEGVIRRLLLKLALLAEYAQPLSAYVALGVLGATALARRVVPVEADALPAARLVLVLAGMSLVFLVLVPVLLRPHLWPSLLLAAVLAGPLLARGLAQHEWRMPVVALLLALVVLTVLCAWGGPQGNPLRDRKNLQAPQIAEARGGYAYVVGMWPKIYVDNGWTPASTVMYPIALPGAPQTWAFKPPEAGSWKARLLTQLREHNERQLLADFARTPPRAIVTIDRDARRPDSSDATDIPVLRDYIAVHCVPGRRLDEDTPYAASLFICGR
ncbi:MAG: hypothetical protein DI603_16680 [Roseateles depolymerans]|uniref:Glycosyltransferase RgtA/B/C/D-like domain-containing protein n=1 Tax=Roseateles depolymerans TaxID=76731 RepID=A0A2W5FAK1_9BURK|nr:MAG: hypothetical protein DI603_16680 [Roseateles depolymerans]